MPNPDGIIETRALAGKSIESNLLANDLQTSTFTATTTFTGPYETSVSGTQRISLASGKWRGFTADANETAPGVIESKISGSGDSRTLQTNVWSPSFLDNEGGQPVGEGGVFLVIRSASFDDSTSPPGIIFGHTGGASTQTAEFIIQGEDFRVQGVGKATIEGELVIPAVTSDPSSPANGNMWLHTVDNALYIWEGGARRTVASW